MIGDLVQNIRLIFLPLISCRKTYPKGTKDLQISSGTTEPFLDIQTLSRILLETSKRALSISLL